MTQSEKEQNKHTILVEALEKIAKAQDYDLATGVYINKSRAIALEALREVNQGAEVGNG